MATSLPNTLGKTGKYGDLKRRLLFLVLALVVAFVPGSVENAKRNTVERAADVRRRDEI